MDKKQKLYLIYNPNSGLGKRKSTLFSIVQCFQDKFDLIIRVSVSREHARDIAKEITSSENNPIVVVAGGDGTVNDIVNGANLNNIILGIIPAGSVNVIAGELGIAQNIKKACEVIANKKIDRIDVSLANDIRFIFCAGLGFDAYIIKNVSLKSKLLFGKSVYGWEFIRRLKDFVPFDAQIMVDGKKVYEGRLFECIAGKSRCYAGKFILFPDASMKNGKIELVALTHQSKASFLSGCFKFFTGRNDPDFRYWRGDRIEVVTKNKIHYHVDGDNGCLSPVTFRLESPKLNIIVP